MAHISRSTLEPSELHESLARKFSEVSEHPENDRGGARLLVCWPAARMNAFQSLLYRKAPESGHAVHRISDLDDLDKIFWPGEVVFHAHWFGPLSYQVESEFDYRANVEAAFDKFDGFRERTGAKFLWTAHNLLPHGTAYPEADTALRQKVISEFEGVHFLGDGHEHLLEQEFRRTPRQSFVARHPHYRGAYADQIERFDARERLGFDPATTIILFFGSIQAYKGIGDLISAFHEARQRGRKDLRLVVAGFPSDEDYISEIAERVEDEETIRFLPSKVPDDQVQLFFRGADAAVLPYVGDQLNSGAALLALSFNCPAIAPNEPAFKSLRRFGVDLYEQKDPSGLADALFNVNRPVKRVDTDAFLAAHDPDKVSTEFFRGVDSLYRD